MFARFEASSKYHVAPPFANGYPGGNQRRFEPRSGEGRSGADIIVSTAILNPFPRNARSTWEIERGQVLRSHFTTTKSLVVETASEPYCAQHRDAALYCFDPLFLRRPVNDDLVLIRGLQ